MCVFSRCVYFLACIFNTMAMMTTSIMFVMMVLLPVVEYIGRYHIMILVILLAAIFGVGILVTVILAIFGMDDSSITHDKVITKSNADENNPLTSVLRFSQVGRGKWKIVLGSVTIIGKSFHLQN